MQTAKKCGESLSSDSDSSLQNYPKSPCKNFFTSGIFDLISVNRLKIFGGRCLLAPLQRKVQCTCMCQNL